MPNWVVWKPDSAAALSNSNGFVQSTRLLNKSITVPEGLRIRDMIIDDIPPVYYLGTKVFTKDKDLFLYRTWETYEVTGLFYSDQELCIVAEHNGIVVGFAMGSIITKPKSPWTYGYLVWTAVLPEYQGRNVAKRLYLETERRVKAFGARMMIIDTEGTNKKAVRFFEKMGFRKGSTHLWMTKILKPRSKTVKNTFLLKGTKQ